jgi:hypothetical protein
MPGLPGFQAALNRKYDIMQQETDARSGLERAQANAIPSSTASENQLRNAQSQQTMAQAGQVAPLAQSQIQEAQARGGYYGAEGRSALSNAAVQRTLALSPLNKAQAQQYTAGVQGKPMTFATPTGAPADTPPPPAQSDPLGATVTDDQARLHHQTLVASQAAQGGVGGAGGASQTSVMGGNTGVGDDTFAPSAFTNTGKFGFQGGNQMQGQRDPVTGLPLKKGTANVKAPPGKGKAPPPKAGGLASLMSALQGAGAGPQAPMPGSPMAGPPPMPGPPSQGAPPQGAPGGMGFMGGVTQVPGQGSGNVDKVPAMLAPHEAVLTHGAANALGRDKIAALNAANPPGAPVRLPSKSARPPLRRGLP